MLHEERTRIVKILLHISRDERTAKLRERLEDPAKQWKFRPEDIEDRPRFGEIEAAYEDALTETSTAWAPWHVVPADHKCVRNAAVTHLLLHALRDLDPQFPEVTLDLSKFEL
jgi:polyphosphate kinase 2 (PPK2 family)